MTRLGYGTYCGFFTLWRAADIEIQLPLVRDCLREFLPSFAEYHDLPDADLENSIPIGMSLDGDYLLVCPDRPGQVFVFPRHDDAIWYLPDGLDDPLHWERLAAGAFSYVLKPPYAYFESFLERSSVSLFTEGAFLLASVAQQLADRWSAAEVPRIDHDKVVLLFPRAIDGRVQITQSPGDPRVGIDITYDSCCASRVEDVVTWLEQKGLYVTGRS